MVAGLMQCGRRRRRRRRRRWRWRLCNDWMCT